MINKKSSLLSTEDKKASQGYVDLKKKTVPELHELLERQRHILTNKSFILKLPDKGRKIILYKDQIEEELKRRDQIDSACELLAGLDINNTNIEDLEWNNGSIKREQKLDSDDDSDVDVDPLKLVATHSGTTQQTRTRKYVPPEPSLITEKDIQETESLSYAEQVCQKFGAVDSSKERFKPNRPKEKKEDIARSQSTKNVKKNLGDKWEVTEATPPVPVYGTTKTISLSESLQLQKEQAERLRDIERKQATEKLFSHPDNKLGETLPTRNITQYRSVKDHFEESVHHGNVSEDEYFDADDNEEEKGGAVFYNLIDDTEET